MNKDGLDTQLLKINFSILTVTPHSWRPYPQREGTGENAFLLASGYQTSRSHFFRDLQTGIILCICSNSTFFLQDPKGYASGTVLAQQMQFEGHDINVWHQDQRFSFTCQANLITGFCFGWLIDRRYSKSYRILDPGKTG